MRDLGGRLDTLDTVIDRAEGPLDLRDGLVRMKARGKLRKDANPAELATALMAARH